MLPEIDNASSEEITRITGAFPRTVKRWKDGTANPPESVLRLLRLFIDGDLATILGNEWEGFRLINGHLYLPGWKRGFTPEEIRSMFFDVQRVSSLEAESRRLKKEMDKLETVMQELKKQRDFYRRQVTLESRFGMLLSKIFA
ncbi:hypothetical protein [Nitrosovibrio sp. Nv4]|uniref:hypothetical protein n=1 Tax=Nitrosovibrio sp. Nv4 TaxID=1945880 RepID=UPI000BD0CA28|nr:hypothetical protein [Nitrosovibrio sp. Nv4]SOD41598.1 hypothetical protein SAMN06298226_1900 [Nitrosovibrio sp. Nv4]